MSQSAGSVSQESSSSPLMTDGILEVKVLLVLKAVGDAIPLKHNKFKLGGNKSILDIEKFLKKQLAYEKALYMYCGNGFSPTPDQYIKDLYDCFQLNNELTIFYGFQEMWG